MSPAKLRRKNLTEIDVDMATRCPLTGLLALDGWTWFPEEGMACPVKQQAVLCSKWHSGQCNECSKGLDDKPKQMTETR